MKRHFKKYVAFLTAGLLLGEALASAAKAGPVPNGRIVYQTDSWQLRILDTGTGLTTTVPLPDYLVAINPVWSPDCQWIVFEANTNHAMPAQIFVVRPDGTDLRRVTDGTRDCVDPDISPDGTRIAYQVVYGDCFIVNFDGSGSVDTGQYLGRVKWSPDGQKLAGSNWPNYGGDAYQSDLYIYDLRSATSRQITHHQSQEAFISPVWSPDGSQLAVMHSTNSPSVGCWQVCVMNADGSSPSDITVNWACQQDEVSWAAGNFLLLVANPGTNYDLWALWPDGSGLTNLTQGSDRLAGRANLSTCQAEALGRIVYVDITSNQLVVADTVFGTNWIVPLPPSDTNSSPYLYVADPEWSPDGQWIVFDANTNHAPPTQIFVVRPDGSGFRRVTDGSDNCVLPTFSCDGSKIAFHTVYGHIFIINTDGTGLVDTGVPGGDVAWFPDCQKLLFDNWPANDYHSDLFIYDLSNQTTQQVTHHQAGEGFLRAVISPDGSRIVCQRRIDNPASYRICIMNIDGSNPQDLTGDLGFDQQTPAWSPDGQFILFSSDHATGSNYDIWAMFPDGTGRTNVIRDTDNKMKPDMHLESPLILSAPVRQTVALGGSATFCVGAVGSYPLAYQWQFDGTNIAGATGQCLALAGLTPAQAGLYDVVITNWSGSITSSTAILSFLDLHMYAGLTLYGPAGTAYSIQCKNDLAQTNWTTLANVTITTSPYLWFDQSSPAYPHRFYRALPLP